MGDEPVVRRGDFARLVPVAAPEAVPSPQRRWSDADWAAICRGHRSRDMDDKWFAFVEDGRLFLHRSWTGRGIYEAQFAHDEDGWFIAELLVSGDRGHYRRASDTYETLFVEAIVDGVLLERWDTDAWARLRSMPRD